MQVYQSTSNHVSDTVVLTMSKIILSQWDLSGSHTAKILGCNPDLLFREPEIWTFPRKMRIARIPLTHTDIPTHLKYQQYYRGLTYFVWVGVVLCRIHWEPVLDHFFLSCIYCYLLMVFVLIRDSSCWFVLLMISRFFFFFVVLVRVFPGWLPIKPTVNGN